MRKLRIDHLGGRTGEPSRFEEGGYIETCSFIPTVRKSAAHMPQGASSE